MSTDPTDMPDKWVEPGSPADRYLDARWRTRHAPTMEQRLAAHTVASSLALGFGYLTTRELDRAWPDGRERTR